MVWIIECGRSPVNETTSSEPLAVANVGPTEALTSASIIESLNYKQ